jgi:CubicO group peptidase (beta-lactamase class C family)
MIRLWLLKARKPVMRIDWIGATLVALVVLASGGGAKAGCNEAAAYSGARSGVALIILQDGRPYCEAYARSFDVNEAIELQSGTKSFSAVIAAAAVQDGLLELDEPVSTTISSWRSDPAKSTVTIRNLLSLNAGLAASVGPGVVPTYDAALGARVVRNAGTAFEYGAVPFAVFGAVMREKLLRAGLSPSPLAYLQNRVLSKIGITPKKWTQGVDGMPHLSSGAHFTARDWARFGEFIRTGGVVNGRSIVDRMTLEESLRPSITAKNYGMTWWLIGTGGLPRGAPLEPDAIVSRAPSDWIMAAGVGKQRLLISREASLTIVRLAPPAGANGWSDRDFLAAILAPPQNGSRANQFAGAAMPSDNGRNSAF